MNLFKIAIAHLILGLLILNCSNMTAQNLKKHQWKNRIIIVLNNSTKNENFKNQISELKSHEKGLKERKLLIYHIEPRRYRIGLNGSDNWVESEKLYQEFGHSDKAFKVILIGLDGGIKLEQNEFLSADKLFSIIDAMPMRKNEIRNKG